MRIGLALSGGGIRATVFHLGAFARLAQQSLIENITFLSTVSGGSLAVALVRACSGNQWPSSDTVLQDTIPKARHLLTSRRLDRAYLQHMLLSPWSLRRGRAAALGGALRDCWSMAGALSDLPDDPRWIINATCYETGKNWRFMKKRMGDYVAGYVLSPQLPITQAVAASAAFPGLVGSLKLDTRGFEWFAYDRAGTPRPHECRFRTLTLWDGGVYDNLGVEALFKPAGVYRAGFDFLIVSDASALLATETRRLRAPLRLLDVATDQVRGLRARAVVSHLQRNPGTGVFLKMGNTQERIYREANRSAIGERCAHSTLRQSEVQEAASVGTTLRRFTKREYDPLLAHGYEVADATLSAYCGAMFEPRPLTMTDFARRALPGAADSYV
ncbi:MAG: patatin-like phospholipase family protein [Acidobacteria bacterium]|nr:patatin-like phospholipase family protein [Acidobacteriota bacterium]